MNFNPPPILRVSVFNDDPDERAERVCQVVMEALGLQVEVVKVPRPEPTLAVTCHLCGKTTTFGVAVSDDDLLYPAGNLFCSTFCRERHDDPGQAHSAPESRPDGL